MVHSLLFRRYDAKLVHEAFYAAATIMSFWRVFYALQLNRAVGPIVVMWYYPPHCT